MIHTIFCQNPLSDPKILKFIYNRCGDVHSVQRLILHLFEYSFREYSVFGNLPSTTPDVFLLNYIKKFYKENCFPSYYGNYASQEDVEEIFDQDWDHLLELLPDLIYLVNRFAKKQSDQKGGDCLADDARVIFGSDEDFIKIIEETRNGKVSHSNHRQR